MDRKKEASTTSALFARFRHLMPFANRNPSIKKDDDIESGINRDEDPLIDPTSGMGDDGEMSLWETMQELFSITVTPGNRSGLIWISALTMTHIASNFIAPYLLSETYEKMAAEIDSSSESAINMIGMIAMVCAFYTCAQMIPKLRDQSVHVFSQHNAKRVVEKSIEHLLDRSLDFHVQKSQGEHITLLQKAFTISNTATGFLVTILPKILESSMAAVILSNQYGRSVGLSLIAMLIVYAGYSCLKVGEIIQAKQRSLNKGNANWEQLMAAIGQYKLMRDFQKKPFVLEKTQHIQYDFIDAEIISQNLPNTVGIYQVIITRMYMVGIAIKLGLQIQKSELPAKSFLFLMGYLEQLCSALPELGQAMIAIVADYPDLKYVLTQLKKPSQVLDPFPNNELTLNAAPSIVFSQIGFDYSSEENPNIQQRLFANMSFTVAAGETIALVSESGVGKSTLLNLLYRYYNPSSGSIYINGNDIARVGLDSLQRQIAIFGQDPNLLKGSIRDNICYGADDPDDVTDEKLWEVVNQAGLGKLIRGFPNQFDHEVGDHGKRLSGGQRQKVALLRGMMKEAPIRLFDEVTSACDSRSSYQIMQSIRETAAGKTTIMISHKAHEVAQADRVIFIGKQGVIDQGSHEHLLEHCEEYGELWQHQHSPTDSSSERSLNLR